jgi:hypothetical protein
MALRGLSMMELLDSGCSFRLSLIQCTAVLVDRMEPNFMDRVYESHPDARATDCEPSPTVAPSTLLDRTRTA